MARLRIVSHISLGWQCGCPRAVTWTCTRQNYCPICQVKPDCRGRRWSGGLFPSPGLPEGGDEPRNPKHHMRQMASLLSDPDTTSKGDPRRGHFGFGEECRGTCQKRFCDGQILPEGLRDVEQTPGRAKHEAFLRALGHAKNDMASILDQRHATLPPPLPNPHTRIYDKKKVSKLFQTTGREQRNLIAQLPVVAQGLDARLECQVHLTANTYMSSYNTHTSSSLDELDRYGSKLLKS
jgi:hypothetical protein